jgi:hypothetical protein
MSRGPMVKFSFEVSLTRNTIGFWLLANSFCFVLAAKSHEPGADGEIQLC